ncbi:MULTISPECIES: helix-hairpin-helix domain-containing protein [Aerococcus]|uniref:ComEA family DNA-binding protein n=1 Tax=Aerococcus sanguinicola TaxID=119206 RepID=A0A5N1GII8_9LACT|nr:MULTISPECIES: helix-hairpin-helix domain-containing protein [Aerococcus]KAA9300775.1 ComEA family DNA-binding protein [Aerococcus sanguinicola]MDK6369440.1 helix-hairpin-helix domain-containing protein [Aerococcus sp. UMB9870]MDK6680503.1 helix-hairpin-helix domain-containing protein [Aerococcus sp. UMB8608]MDK6686697.1 helix-hairpin-helix domain-containing protein [Aerococcus sp. UMB8623]MDK6940450.1 helix-hairpin-helix domain-containing protein [Aerococcus sp. UMB8487]
MWNRWKDVSLANMVRDYGRYLLGGLVGICLVGFFLGRFLAGNEVAEVVEEVPVAESVELEAAQAASIPAESSAASSQTPVEETLYVDVKGAVKEPKLYQVEAGMRVYDAVMLAGGFLPEAAQDQVNFAQRLEDQMLVYIPREGEEVPDHLMLAGQKPGGQATSGQGDPASGDKVNLNTADSAELQTLSGVGEKKAADIIAYREANGPFQTVDDLSQVSGIGEKTLDKLRPQLTVD